MKTIVLRILLVLSAVVFTGLLVEGALSLIAGRSLRPRPLVELARLLESQPGDAFSGAEDGGPYRVHPDPRVRLVLRRGEGYELGDSTFSADRFGVRGRPGPEPTDDAIRIAILGDSVAFGSGVNDDQTLAAQLESVLHTARGDGVPRVACYTVAVPGWNHRNAVAFLRDHYDTYRPDIVIYMPIENDLTDGYAVGDLGTRRIGGDPLARDPLLAVNDEPRLMYVVALADRILSGKLTTRLAPHELGVHAITADLTRESRRRYDDNATSIARLSELVEEGGGRLALLFYGEQAASTGYVWFLRERLRARVDVPEIPALGKVLPSMTLPGDPHPNADCLRGIAIWTAEWLLERGWIDRGADRPLPPVPDVVAGQRVTERTDAEVTAWTRARRDRGDRGQTRLDLTTGLGIHQVFGGIQPDGSLGPRGLFMLRLGGDRVTVEAEPLSPAPVDGPVVLTIEVEDEVVGELTVSGDPARVTLPVPEGVTADYIEVRLSASTWRVVEAAGHEVASSCRLLAIESHGDER